MSGLLGRARCTGRERAALPAACLLFLLAGAPASVAQGVREINPTQSPFYATDPNAASGGRVNGMTWAGDSVVFAASEWGGLFRSADGGRTWDHVPGHLPAATWAVAADPRDATRVYATSFYDGRLETRAGISVSVDGGATWTRPPTALPPWAGFCLDEVRQEEPSAFGISIDPEDPDRVAVGTACGLALSEDAGASWTYVNPDTATARTIWDVIIHDGGTIDVCGNYGHRRSTDGGVTWTGWEGLPSRPLPAGRCSLAVSPDESYVLFAVVGESIYESDDGGASWPSRLTNPHAQGRIPFVRTNKRSDGTFDLWFGDVELHRASCTTPANPAPGGTPRCPTNTWTGPLTAGAHLDAGDLLFDPTASVDACPRLFSSDGGVYRNTVTTSPACHDPAWTQPDRTPRALWLHALAGAPRPGNAGLDLYMGTQDNGILAATDGRAVDPTWSRQRSGDSFDVVADSQWVVYTMCCGRLFIDGPGLLTGGGVEINNYPPGNLPGFRPSPIIDQFGPAGYVLVTRLGVFVTKDIMANPVQWTPLGAAPPVDPFVAGQSVLYPFRAVRASVPAGAPPTFYMQVGVEWGADQLWRFNGTESVGAWQQIATPDGTGGFGVYAVDRSNPERLFASHLRLVKGPQMVLSEDGGATWTSLPDLDLLMTGGGDYRYQTRRGPTPFTSFSGYPQPTLVAIDPNDPNILVAGGADTGVFLSTNGGARWIRVTSVEPPAPGAYPYIPRPVVAYFDHRTAPLVAGDFWTSPRVVDIYIGTQGRGVWRITLRRKANIVALCGRHRDLCRLPELERGLIRFDCPADGSGIALDIGCIVRDPLPRNCQLKYPCPPCDGLGLCPPYYHIYLDDLDPAVWTAGIYTAQGEPVLHEMFRTKTGLVVSFRPERRLFRPGQIGDYELVLMQSGRGRSGAYAVRSRLEVSDRPFQP